MRCDGCDGKFGSNGEPEADGSEDINGTTLSAELELRVPCGNCGGDFKTGTADVEVEIDTGAHDEECIYQPAREPGSDKDADPLVFSQLPEAERDFTCVGVNVDVYEEYRPKLTRRTLKDGTVKTKPVPFRFQRHYYDLVVTFTVNCSFCGNDFDVTAETSLGASELESVN